MFLYSQMKPSYILASSIKTIATLRTVPRYNLDPRLFRSFSIASVLLRKNRSNTFFDGVDDLTHLRWTIVGQQAPVAFTRRYATGFNYPNFQSSNRRLFSSLFITIPVGLSGCILAYKIWEHLYQKQQQQPSLDPPLNNKVTDFHDKSSFGKIKLILQLCRRITYLFLVFFPISITAPLVYLVYLTPFQKFFASIFSIWVKLLVRQLEKAGATFIKLGQWAATRTDLFPPDLCNQLCKFHSHVTPHNFDHTEKIIKDSFKVNSISDVFLDFAPVPIGVGSIAQVYTATLKNACAHQQDNSAIESYKRKIKRLLSFERAPEEENMHKSVAVKVLHPNVGLKISLDLKILEIFASLFNLIPTMKWLSFPQEVKVFGDMLNQQLDLRHEAQNLIQFSKNFEKKSYVEFPMVYENYTKDAVLVEEFIPGIPLSLFLRHKDGPFNKCLANVGNSALFQMLILDNFTHADLHSGNIIVGFKKGSAFASNYVVSGKDLYSNLMSSDDEEWKSTMQYLQTMGYQPFLTYLDAGLVTKLSPQDLQNFIDLFQAVLTFKGYEAGLLMVERSRQTELVRDREVFALKMEHLLNGIQKNTLSLKSLQIGTILQEVMTMSREHHVRIEANFANTVLSILLMEGAGRQLYPDMDILSNATPFLRAASAKSNISLKSPMIKLWLALEARQFLLLSTSKETVETWIKADMISPNI
ncbi:atypical/ABC1/ABC1-C protein kinase [Schizosaccharomyces cryophilus OY26]|uniref:Atypical/ABC1/ABC1-C protein kinase n=1 Tax=Schizosaccharomyces cryophilus (strain OY26 / ATCC MYA-4695 / CBS 11777 / NBRC 106824 / NRRL Y48691) TaxID=653667 RepID=S9X8Y3_SCHCR|nr:atypical/ABC1/ABC1-C protein kinase [Schizosaccharomyces cryophilus OY26]EPY53657.1 atypical/ABC1/ABC1-C protein kinase [Schizosaccharomyces cryophilus OY26]